MSNEELEFELYMQELLEKVSRGDSSAQANLGDILLEDEDYGRAYILLLQSAKKGNAYAQKKLGLMYQGYYPNSGMKDDAEAVRWFTRASKQGEKEATSLLALHYSLGWGVQKNMMKAIKLWEKAAQQNYAPALFSLGQMYFKGIDEITQDCKKAKEFILKAVQNGFQGVCEVHETLAKIYEEEKDYNLAYSQYEEALKALNAYVELPRYEYKHEEESIESSQNDSKENRKSEIEAKLKELEKLISAE